MLSLQEHLADTHLLAGFFFVVLQEHLTSSTTASGAICTLDNKGFKTSSSLLHPSDTGSGKSGCKTRSCSHTWDCRCALRTCCSHAPCVGGRSSTPLSLPSCLNEIHLTCSGFAELASFLQKMPLKNSMQPYRTSSMVFLLLQVLKLKPRYLNQLSETH